MARLLGSLKALFAGRRMEKDLDEEIGFHVERETEENIRRGMSPPAARTEALRRFGGVEKTKEEVREADRAVLFETMLQDVRYGLRALRKNPGYAAAAVLTLALGIGANTAIFSVVHGVILQSLPYGGGDQLVRARSSVALHVYRRPDEHAHGSPLVDLRLLGAQHVQCAINGDGQDSQPSVHRQMETTSLECAELAVQAPGSLGRDPDAGLIALQPRACGRQAAHGFCAARAIDFDKSRVAHRATHHRNAKQLLFGHHADRNAEGLEHHGDIKVRLMIAHHHEALPGDQVFTPPSIDRDAGQAHQIARPAIQSLVAFARAHPAQPAIEDGRHADLHRLVGSQR